MSSGTEPFITIINYFNEDWHQGGYGARRGTTVLQNQVIKKIYKATCGDVVKY